MWRDLEAAHQAGRLQVVAGRASDFFGPGVGAGSVVGGRFFGALVKGKAAEVTGDPGCLHTYTYIDDFGQALVRLSEAPQTWGRAWHVPSAPAVSTRALAERAAALPGAAENMLVLYHSRTLAGQDTAVSGTVSIPPGHPPAGGWQCSAGRTEPPVSPTSALRPVTRPAIPRTSTPSSLTPCSTCG